MIKFSGMIAATILAANYEPSIGDELIAARNVRSGAVITAADIVTPKGEESLRRAARLIGQETLRTLYQGQPFSETDLHAPTIVTRSAGSDST